MYVEYLRVSGGRARGGGLSLQVAVAAPPRRDRRPTSGVLESLAFSSREPRERLSNDPRRPRCGAATRPRPIQSRRGGVGARRSAVETSFGAGAARLLGLLLLLVAGLLGRLRGGGRRVGRGRSRGDERGASKVFWSHPRRDGGVFRRGDAPWPTSWREFSPF